MKSSSCNELANGSDQFDDTESMFCVMSTLSEEVVNLESARVVFPPQPPRAAEGRNAAFHADARAREGGEILRGADEGGGGADRELVSSVDCAYPSTADNEGQGVAASRLKNFTRSSRQPLQGRLHPLVDGRNRHVNAARVLRLCLGLWPINWRCLWIRRPVSAASGESAHCRG